MWWCRKKIAKSDPGSYGEDGNTTDDSSPSYAQLLDALVVKAAGKKGEYNVKQTRPVKDAVVEMVRVLTNKVSVS